LMSCWTDAQSGQFLPLVRLRLGRVEVQGKGLLSTEGVVSVPIQRDLPPVLAIRSHFYEFKKLDSNEVVLAHQLTLDEKYEVMLTTAGGLYRYATGDIVSVVNSYKKTPALRFEGRARVSDMVGEKLSELEVVEALKPILNHAFCAFLMAEMDARKSFNYNLCLFTDVLISDDVRNALCAEVERALQRNPYYTQALKLAQLKPLTCTVWNRNQYNQIAAALAEQKQIRDGNFKMPALIMPDQSLNILKFEA